MTLIGFLINFNNFYIIINLLLEKFTHVIYGWYKFYLESLNIVVLNYLIIIVILNFFIIFRIKMHLLFSCLVYLINLKANLFLNFKYYLIRKLFFMSLLVGLINIHPLVLYTSIVFFFLVIWKNFGNYFFLKVKFFWIFWGLLTTFVTGGLWSMFILNWSFFWVFDIVEFFPILFFLIWGYLIHKDNTLYPRLALNIFSLGFVAYLYIIRLGFVQTRHSFFSGTSLKNALWIYGIFFFISTLIAFVEKKSYYNWSWFIIFMLLYLVSTHIKILFIAVLFSFLIYICFNLTAVYFTRALQLFHMFIILISSFLFLKHVNLLKSYTFLWWAQLVDLSYILNSWSNVTPFYIYLLDMRGLVLTFSTLFLIFFLKKLSTFSLIIITFQVFFKIIFFDLLYLFLINLVLCNY